MGRVNASSAKNRGLDPLSGQTSDYEIGISCFSVKHTVSRSKSNDWLARNRDNLLKG